MEVGLSVFIEPDGLQLQRRLKACLCGVAVCVAQLLGDKWSRGLNALRVEVLEISREVPCVWPRI